jgi:hypothetical protein
LRGTRQIYEKKRVAGKILETKEFMGLEGAEVAWQMDLEERDNLQAPGLVCYIAIVCYIFK